jgi:hypothetical protein
LTARAACPIGRSNTTATTSTSTAAHDGRAAKTCAAGSISPTAARAAKICLRCARGIDRCTSDAPIASRRSSSSYRCIASRPSQASTAATATTVRRTAATATAAITRLHSRAAESRVAAAAAIAAIGIISSGSRRSASAYAVGLRRSQISRIVKPLNARGSTASASPRSRRAICN